jgi:rhodanese-related sulfurtransferase
MKKTIFIIVLCISFISCKKEHYSLSPISQEEFSKLNSKKIQLLDVRTPEEINAGFIEGSIAINYFEDDFINKVKSQFDESKPIYLYCASSTRSIEASSKLIIDRSFSEIYYLEGGYNTWKENNK